jgi:hypothetical protein
LWEKCIHVLNRFQAVKIDSSRIEPVEQVMAAVDVVVEAAAGVLSAVPLVMMNGQSDDCASISSRPAQRRPDPRRCPPPPVEPKRQIASRCRLVQRSPHPVRFRVDPVLAVTVLALSLAAGIARCWIG